MANVPARIIALVASPAIQPVAGAETTPGSRSSLIEYLRQARLSVGVGVRVIAAGGGGGFDDDGGDGGGGGLLPACYNSCVRGRRTMVFWYPMIPLFVLPEKAIWEVFPVLRACLAARCSTLRELTRSPPRTAQLPSSSPRLASSAADRTRLNQAQAGRTEVIRAIALEGSPHLLHGLWCTHGRRRRPGRPRAPGASHPMPGIRRRRDCHSAAIPFPFSRCFDMHGEGM